MHDWDIAVKVAVTIVAAIIVQLIVRESVNTLVHQVVKRNKYSSAAEEEKREKTLLHVFRPVSRTIIWAIALIVVLGLLGVNLAALITGAGAVGIIFGIMAQSAFKDYIAGIYIILENQYRVGDVVMLAGTTSGVVEDISIRVTALRDLDGNLHYVRNGEAGVITNMTSEWANSNVELQVGWDADIDQVEKIINQIGNDQAKDDRWAGLIVEPIQFYRVDGFTDSAVVIRALGKTTPINQWDVAGDFRRRVKKEFDKHKVPRPYQQRLIHKVEAANK